MTGTEIVLIALAAVIALSGAAVVLRGRDAGRGALDVIATLSVGLAFLLFCAAIDGRPRWGPWEHQPSWVAIASLAIAVPFGAWRADGRRARIVAAIALAAALGAIAIAPAMRAEWGSAAVGAAWLVGLSLAAAVALALLAGASLAAPGSSAVAVVAVTAAGASALALLSHYAKLGLSAAALAAALALHAIALRLRRPPAPATPGLVLAGLTPCLALLLGGYLHVLESDRVAGVWFVIAGCAPALAGLASIGDRGGRGRAAARVAIAIALVALAVAGGAWTTLREDSGGEPASDQEAEWSIGR